MGIDFSNAFYGDLKRKSIFIKDIDGNELQFIKIKWHLVNFLILYMWYQILPHSQAVRRQALTLLFRRFESYWGNHIVIQATYLRSFLIIYFIETHSQTHFFIIYLINLLFLLTHFCINEYRYLGLLKSCCGQDIY